MKEKISSLGGPAEALVTGASHLVKPALDPMQKGHIRTVLCERDISGLFYVVLRKRGITGPFYARGAYLDLFT